MSSAQAIERQRVPRKDCRYTLVEQEQILPYKNKFIEATTTAERLLVLKNEILPKMFNYWRQNGKSPRDRDESRLWAKELSVWLSNNWRMKYGRANQTKALKISRHTFMWRTRREEVKEEMSKLIGTEAVGKGGKKTFVNRTKATAIILKRMTDGERIALDAEIEATARNGNDEDTKRMLAVRIHSKRIKTGMVDQFKEMGSLSVVFSTYVRPDGKILMSCLEDMADLLGVSCPTFLDTYPDEIFSMKALMLKYVQSLYTRKEQGEVTLGTTPSKERPDKILKPSDNGFPILPNPIPSKNWTKLDWEKLLRCYMGAQYLLAGGKSAKKVPYTEIEKHQAQFIDKMYLPLGFRLKQSRNMAQGLLTGLFQHFIRRQEMHGPDATFRFKSIRINGKTLPAQYDADPVFAPEPEIDCEPISSPDPVVGPDAFVTVEPDAFVTVEPDALVAAEPEIALEPYDIYCDNGHTQPATPDMTPEPSPARTHEAAGQSHEHEPIPGDIAVVSEQEMHRLRFAGYTVSEPINGPADGPPQYLAAMRPVGPLMSPVSPRDVTRPWTPEIDPALLGLNVNGAQSNGLNVFQIPSPRSTPAPMPVPTPSNMPDPKNMAGPGAKKPTKSKTKVNQKPRAEGSRKSKRVDAGNKK